MEARDRAALLRSAAALELGFPRDWLDSELFEDDLLEQLVARFRAGKDRNREHYRYAALKHVISSNPPTRELVARFLRLVETEPDRAAASSTLVDLLGDRRLSEEVFELVASHISTPDMRRVAFRRRLERRLAGNPTEADLLECLRSGEPSVHRLLVEREELPDSILAALAAEGANRAVRKLAATRLRRK